MTSTFRLDVTRTARMFLGSIIDTSGEDREREIESARRYLEEDP